MKEKKSPSVSGIVIITGALVGFLGALLVKLGNPGNMGICVACFLRDIAGSLGLHRTAPVQYIRPEIVGLVLGAFITALYTGEFRAQGGSSPLIRFLLGGLVMIGALVFLGCPVRMVLRLGGGDLNALLAVAGFVGGIYVGILFLKNGFTLGRATNLSKVNGWILPLIMLGVLLLLIARPAFIFLSTEGPGSRHAPIVVSLLAGLIIGTLAQRSRFCFAGGIRDLILIRNPHLFNGFIAVLVAVTIFNIIFGQFQIGFSAQPVAHNNHLWNFMGMLLVGLGATLLGGCPLRQLILTGEGNTDSAMVVVGMVAGAGFAHNFKLASTPQGPSVNSEVAVIIGIITCIVIGMLSRQE